MITNRYVNCQEKGLIALSSSDIAELTGGNWEGLNEVITFTGVSVGNADVSKGELYVALGKEHCSSSKLETLRSSGASAVVVQRKMTIAFPILPLLRVDDPRIALSIIAKENVGRVKAKRILVTGTEGKTGLKIMLHHVISQQSPCHAILNSSNLHIPIWRSMASIHSEDEYAIIEISVANPKRGWQRSKIICPHICVFTNISPQHMVYHGNMESLIHNKAEAITAIQSGGVCFINADNEYFLELKRAIQRIRRVPVMSFGSELFCEGQLINAVFVHDRAGWDVHAKIFGQPVNYFISMINSYAPLASVSALTIAAYLDLDLSQAATGLAHYQPFETAGRIVTLPVKSGEFTLFDHSKRGSVAGFSSAFDDLYRVNVKRKIRLVLGAILDLGEQEKEPIHRQLASLIDTERTEKIYTVGDEMHIFREAFSDKSLLGPHGNTPEEIAEELFNDIEPGDVVLVKGHHRVWLERLTEAMVARFKLSEVTDTVVTFTPTKAESFESASVFTEPVNTIIAGGDVMLARDMPGRVAKGGVSAPFHGVSSLLERADITLVNLECVLSGKGDFLNKGERRPFYYRCPPAMVNVLVEAGISMVTTANNHAVDFGPEALADQSQILKEAGIAYAGSGANLEQATHPVFFRAGGLVVAVLSFATDLPQFAVGEGKWGIFNVSLGEESLNRLRPAIEAARDNADLVIVSPHWGANWRDSPKEEIRELARGLINLGVDAVIGHSAHILQGIEVYRGKPIVYDMGTALFDRVQENRMRHSALFELVFGQRGFECLIVHPVELEPGRVRLASDEEGAITMQLVKEMSLQLDSRIEFTEKSNALELHLTAQGITRRKLEPENVHSKNSVRHIDPESGSFNEANIFHADLLPELNTSLCADLGGGLKVLGARFPDLGRAGYGFVLEVFFRYPDTEGRRWRASIRGIDPNTGTDFRYRHPVAEGMWVSEAWCDERIINDRVVVRPPIDLAPAKYELYWNLVDADTGSLRKMSSDDPRIRDNWLHLGAIDITKDAPCTVAGLS